MASIAKHFVCQMFNVTIVILKLDKNFAKVVISVATVLKVE